MPVPLFTSLPPTMSRLDGRGNEIGPAYQQHCIESWRRAGFEPISVNSAAETYEHPVRRTVLERDAVALTGRSHVFLADVLAVASSEARGGPFVLMNADLMIPPDTDLGAVVSGVSRREFVFGRRTDIDEVADRQGVPYVHGYDFFAGRADDIPTVPDSGMIFGAPWWDHLFPLLMLSQGCRLWQAAPVVLHLRHEERWSWAVWERLGSQFVAEARSHVQEPAYRRRLGDALEGRSGRLLPDAKHALAKRLPSRARAEPRRTLHRVSQATLTFLDDASEPSE